MPNVLIITFEYKDIVFGGIGSCLNGSIPFLNKEINSYVARFVGLDLPDEFRVDLFKDNPVSYTHLTLPTILLV